MKLKKGVFVLVAIMLLTIPNLSVYSAVGSYSSNSPSLVANSNAKFNNSYIEEASWRLAIAAVAGAVVLAYDTGYVLGTIAHHAYHFFGDEDEMALAPADYNSTDFSKFDN